MPPVSDASIFSLILMPIIYDILLYAVYFSGKMPGISAGGAAIAIIFVVFDANLLRRAGYEPLRSAMAWGLLFYPVYIYQRSVRLMRKKTLFFLSLAVLLVPVLTGFAWPFLDDQDLEEAAVEMTNSILAFLQPEITVQCTSAKLEKRLPWARFEVISNLDDGKEIKLPLKQSWQYVRADGDKNIVFPEEIGIMLLKKASDIQKSGIRQ